MNGAHALIESLLQEGVTHMFGYAGATICPAVDALKEHPEIAYTLVRTEQNAGHMASGYARISGKVGVCMVTSGPGATNLITGIATAYMDSIPMVAITGPVPNEVPASILQKHPNCVYLLDQEAASLLPKALPGLEIR